MATVLGTGSSDQIFVGSASAGVTPSTGATDGADSITGLAGFDTIFGGGGNDTIDGGAAGDSIDGGLGSDSIRGGSGNDNIAGEQGNNTIDGGTGLDTIVCGADNDSLIGGADNDFLDGGGGRDTLVGGTGADFMRGNFGSDLYFVDNIGDTVQEFQNEGNDTVQSSISYTLPDFVENLTLTGAATTGTGNAVQNSILGNANANTLSGLGSGDTLNGANGNDTLIGGLGADRLIGGAGSDLFDYNAVGESGPTAADTIAGFDGVGVAGGDRIDLHDIDANVGVSGNQDFVFGGAFTAGHLRLTDAGGNTILEGNIDGDSAAEIRIVIADGGITAAMYRALDFIL